MSLAARVGCQTYTWQAAREAGLWEGVVQEILDAIAAAGYAGVETTPAILGELFDHPERFRAALAERGLALAALALSPPSGWTDPSAEAAELALAERAIRFLEAFGPGARLALGGGRRTSARPLDACFTQMIRMYHRVAERAVERGLVVNVHPTSAPGSIIRRKADYERLVGALDPSLVSLGPDTGHITRGDESALGFIQRHAGRVTHVHLKDAVAGGEYAMMGSGDADIPGVVRFLLGSGYQGWLIAEEESAESLHDPGAAVSACRRYLRSLGC